ncbi:MAG: hypothetical protein AAB576_01870, partial [Elusimicrobiota bacterium]
PIHAQRPLGSPLEPVVSRRKKETDSGLLWAAWLFLLIACVPLLSGALTALRNGLEGRSRAASLRGAEARARLRYRSFDRADPASDSDLFFDLRSESVLEGAHLLKAEKAPHGLFLVQPGELPAGWSYDVTGAALMQVHGQVAVEASLDLSESRFHAREPSLGQVSSLSMGLQLDAEKTRALTVQFFPGGGGSLGGTLLCSAPSSPMALDSRVRSLRLRMERRASRVEVTVILPGRAPKVLCGVESTQALRPIQQIDLGAFLWRPRGLARPREYRPKERDAYAVSFSLKCLDPGGCKARSHGG